MQLDRRIEDTQAAAVHTALLEDARSALELLGQVDMGQEGTEPDVQGPVVVLEEADLAVVEAVHRHFFHLLEVQEVHEEILGCSTVQSHPQPVDIVDADHASLRCQAF